jgi:hypothetical protein
LAVILEPICKQGSGGALFAAGLDVGITIIYSSPDIGTIIPADILPLISSFGEGLKGTLKVVCGRKNHSYMI